MTRRNRAFSRLVLASTLAGCGGAGLPAPGIPGPGAPPVTVARGVPGFDTRDYPGDATMAAWRAASPYRWVGYYLPAPCYTGTSWEGRRPALERMGWGVAVLFVGEQDWPAGASRGDTAATAVDPRCTRTNLTPARGTADGAAAASAAAAEGFAPGTVVYLDVERVDAVSPQLLAYVRAWFDALLGDGRYLPGMYAHADNAATLMAAARAALEDAGHGGSPALWVVRTDGFGLERAPTESGFPAARVWQGRLDVTESWGGHALRIDANVAADANPSG